MLPLLSDQFVRRTGPHPERVNQANFSRDIEPIDYPVALVVRQKMSRRKSNIECVVWHPQVLDGQFIHVRIGQHCQQVWRKLEYLLTIVAPISEHRAPILFTQDNLPGGSLRHTLREIGENGVFVRRHHLSVIVFPLSVGTLRPITIDCPISIEPRL
ncbi:hypothetical protein A0U93_11645 [Neoasaia chiangmaiensis]|uniref:Uncharacterized protein n=1 Tax=Neoasaia chiangmaiensis TaxID=320497 RepID=A0A1U9KRZ0_9PROT|nr:hypothetical protein A0U93_11645 [Neoasaia chiangmaiensis]